MIKPVIVLALLIFTFSEIFAQNENQKSLIEEYLRQSENQKKTGIIMISAGAAAAALGLLIATSSNWYGYGLDTGGFVFLAGSVSAIVGIPIIISSASKARKAGKLSLDLNTARVIHQRGTSNPTYPALKISIPLYSTSR
ncbi:hypothetical protein SYJ56_06295 [Algoriphagus sp. D3-2-R+10]|uniref:hypothetical protein n=1 Tax=Algoriphagus aurantiacus TaxID=3103948 RepID=UPI002B37A8BF|nr:hypothetical protein [Algoriphagus sp. D3-2-R+10]MEB2774907.1 hypothetical protein [Algoriphagus sp. D3-2-R+10]